jgi:hypothetical protein
MRKVLVPLLLLAGCASTQHAATQPAGESWVTDADKLAHRVRAHHGFLEDVRRVAFSFVVVVDGEEKSRRRHERDFERGTLKVTFADGAVVSLSDIDAVALSERSRSEESETAKAWGSWINDWFWLVAQSKSFDAGTERSVDEGRLVVRYASGGVTPGDTYRFTVDEAGRVTAWSYTLGSGREGAYAWLDEQVVGPLRLSTRRRAEGKDVEIRFEDIDIVAVPIVAERAR